MGFVPTVGRNPSPRIGRNPSSRPPTAAAPLPPMGASTLVDPNGWLVSVVEDSEGMTITVDWDAAVVPATPVPSDGVQWVWEAIDTVGRPLTYPLSQSGELILDFIEQPAASSPTEVGLFFAEAGDLLANYWGGALNLADAGSNNTPWAWSTGDLKSNNNTGVGAVQVHATARYLPTSAPSPGNADFSQAQALSLGADNARIGRGTLSAAASWADATPAYCYILSVFPAAGATGTAVIKVKPHTHFLSSRASRGVR